MTSFLPAGRIRQKKEDKGPCDIFGYAPVPAMSFVQAAVQIAVHQQAQASAFGRTTMQKRTVMTTLARPLSLLLLAGGLLVQPECAQALSYNEAGRAPLPIPVSERSLQTDQAVPWYTVSKENHILEGAIFDADGSLLFCDVTDRAIRRLTRDKKLSTVLTMPDGFHASGLAFHRDGRLFIAAGHAARGLGCILALAKDGTLATILPTQAGFIPNDLCFDKMGGLYFTDFKGTATEPEGGVYYLTPAGDEVHTVIPRMARANGIALSPDGTTLWATEFCRNLLHMVYLQDATTPMPTGSFIAYRFTGPAPDSMRVDADGNVYVALCRQGRVLVFNRYGIPTGQVLIPGREEERNIRTTSLAIRPGARDLYIVSGNSQPGTVCGSGIFAAQAFARGLPATR